MRTTLALAAATALLLACHPAGQAVPTPSPQAAPVAPEHS
jgi:hypothetical protein